MNNRDICRMPVSKDFRQMFKARAYREGKSVLQLSREEAREMRDKYGGGKSDYKPLFFKN